MQVLEMFVHTQIQVLHLWLQQMAKSDGKFSMKLGLRNWDDEVLQ